MIHRFSARAFPCSSFAAIISLVLAANAQAGRVIPDDPGAYGKTESLGDLLRSRGARPVHVIYVHGMAATGSNNSQTVREALTNHLMSTKQLQGAAPSDPVTRRLLEFERRPTEASINGIRVWNSEEEWIASKPFVDRYTFQGGNKRVVGGEA